MSDSPDSVQHSSDIERICQRVREKSASYDNYNFSSRFNDFLKAFFDLCQEYDSLDDFCCICVAVPLEMTGLASALYLFDENKEELQLVCDSELGFLGYPETAPPHIRMQSKPYETDHSYIVPIYSKSLNNPKTEDPETQYSFSFDDTYGKNRIFGMFEVKGLAKLTPSDKFFFVKYCNRIGYNLHNRLVSIQNIDHLNFINSLVMDIEHNVIVPNMYFKHFFNQLNKKILELRDLKNELRYLPWPENYVKEYNAYLDSCDSIFEEMLSNHQDLVKHHANVSLFLESLFRREHFKKGHLVLRTSRCFVEKEIILPQLDNYASRLRAANVTIDRPRNMLEEEFEIYVDVGLLSQVYANLFSNATKYTKEIIDHHGQSRKAIAYGRELVTNYPEEGKQGIKFNVFSTGPHLKQEEAYKLFDEGVRGEGTDNQPGTGHGLAFIKHVIERHGGTVGYEPTREGNNFYFILPIPPITNLPVIADPGN